MSVIGSWNLTIDTAGEFLVPASATVDLETTGDPGFMMNYPLAGIFQATGDFAVQQPDATSAELSGNVQGSDFNWDTQLMIGLHFSGTVDGDRMSGTMSSEGLPSFPFSGVRA